ncbi:hypothetical protein [sulfur-oxidizing endosymbiont of Gigantopelta aegis]|uniref:hypothetical protein n=1 Tax=sulfur-oxidizing endosymbiont of Gigantopelta aegis TaxID=2794934 RepID=UPI0018DBCA3D|nr:hypothetical protein [sulfur-oxidizing endosymbiont of Gigantopelta aegis]
MTEVLQNALAGRHSVDETSNHTSDRGQNGVRDRQALNEGTQDSILGTVNISFNAQMRLQAYQEQKNQLVMGDVQPLSKEPLQALEQKPSQLLNKPLASELSSKITNMLTEVENNIVQSSEPGYRYLVNMLNNYGTKLEDPGQLQEVMRKEEFYLNRRKAFMDSSEYQSYSQVLNQFSNIIGRQQYA